MDLCIIGDVQIILKGEVTSQSLHSVSVKELPYALGGAAIPGSNPISIGETIIFDGMGHIFTVEKPWTETNNLHAAFLMGIERKPKEFYQTTKKQTIQALYEDLGKNTSTGFVITGHVHFSKLLTAYLQLSPIYGENINVLHDKYWHTETTEENDVQLFGVVLKQPNPKAFYHNPNEKENSSLPSHSHVLIPLARHLLTNSELTSGSFWIEEIENVKMINSSFIQHK